MNLEKSNWEIKQIGETCELIKEVYQPKKTESLPYIGLEHINQQILSINAIGNSGDVDSLKFKFKKGQVLFGKLRPYFRKVYLPNFDGICSTDIWVINARKGFYNPYLFYFFASKEIVDRITKSSEGTRMPRGKWNYLENLEYPFPPFNGQQAIANILLKLDEKIELNNQMNQTLETMGKVLFKEWFIDGKKKEWKTSTIGEELKTVLGGTPSRLKTEYWGGDINWINSGKVNEFRIVEPSEKITEEGLKKSATTLLLKGSVVIAITGATLGQVSRLEIDSCANQSVIGIIGNGELSSEYTYYWIKNQIKDIISHQTGGAQQHINKSNIDNYSILIPDSSTLKNFNELSCPLFKQIKINCFQNQALSQIRDTLLPKLMSGEVRVKS